MAMPENILYKLLHQKKMFAAEVDATSPTRRAWIGIYPLFQDDGYCNIRYFEVDKRILESKTDIGESLLLNKETIRANIQTELEGVLARWLDDFNKLVDPYFCDYPI